MIKKFIFSIFIIWFYTFELSAQVKIYGSSPEEGTFCSGGIWSMELSDSTTFNNFINYAPATNSIISTENYNNRRIIQDGSYYYYLEDIISCSNQSQLIRIDLFGNNRTQIKIFDTKINFLFKGDEDYLYGISSNEKKLFKITKTNGSILNIFDFESDLQNYTSVITKNDLVFVSDKDKIYEVKNNGTQKKIILDNAILLKQTNTYYNSIIFENSAFDENNIYIPLTGNIPAYIVTIPFNNASNYKLQQIRGYDYIQPSKLISIDGNLYFIALKNFVGKKFLKVDNSFKTITEIEMPVNLNAERIITQNSKKIILQTAYEYLIYDTERNLFIKDLSQDSYNFSYLSTNKFSNFYFNSDFSNSFNFLSLEGIGRFDLTKQLPQAVAKFEESKSPVQIIDAHHNKLLVLNRQKQSDYVAQVDLVKGKITKEIQLPERYKNNILAVDSLHYLYTNYQNSYIFTIDSVFKKIETPTNIRLDSLYKVKNKIFTSGDDGVYEFKENTFKKFISFSKSLKIGFFESDDDAIYISQLLLDSKTYHFYKLTLDGNNLSDLGISIAPPNYGNQINPQCVKVGGYIYGTLSGLLFRVNIQTKEYQVLQSLNNKFSEIKYSVQDKKIYGLSSFVTFEKGQIINRNSIVRIDEAPFTFVPIKSIKETKKVFLEKVANKIQSNILSNERRNELSNLLVFPNPVNDYIKIFDIDYEDNIELYNQLGQKFEIEVLFTQDNYCVIDFSKFTEGVYFIKTKRKTFKVVKQ
ncbi:MAG: T9SS type A sorting domain-containing protein [Bacteroidia bacterium]